MTTLAPAARHVPSGVARLRDDPVRRERVRTRVHHYLNMPAALASILFVLVGFIQFSNTGGEAVPWHRRFWQHGPPALLFWGTWAFLVLEFLFAVVVAPDKKAYIRNHWPEAAAAALPGFGVLRLADAAVLAPLLHLLADRGEHPRLAILRKRKLGLLLLVTALVILLAAVLEYLFEYGARGATITTFGQALWWAAATVTTVANQLYPVTTGGEIVGFLLMVYAVVVFAYLASSMASALIGGDAQEAAQQANASGQAAQQGQSAVAAERTPRDGPIALTQSELEALRALLERAQATRQGG